MILEWRMFPRTTQLFGTPNSLICKNSLIRKVIIKRLRSICLNVHRLELSTHSFLFILTSFNCSSVEKPNVSCDSCKLMTVTEFLSFSTHLEQKYYPQNLQKTYKLPLVLTQAEFMKRTVENL